MKRFIGLVAVIGLTLTAVTGCATGDIMPSDKAIESLFSESEAISNFCKDLKGLLPLRGDVADISKCEEETDKETGGAVVVVLFEDQGMHIIENDIKVTFDTAFAPLTAMAQAYKMAGDSRLSSIQLFLVAFNDTCGWVWEVEAQTLSKYGSGEISIEQAMSEVDLFSDPNCP